MFLSGTKDTHFSYFGGNVLLKKILDFYPNNFQMEFLILNHCVKAWKREAMDLLVDSTFFQMDLSSLRHWKTTVDNLMTHDKTTFKELMSK